MLKKFLAFKTHVEQKSGKAIKVLRMDNGTRYLNRRIRDFCRLEGIDLQTPAPFSPHKTNVAAFEDSHS